jgi:N-acetylneuraminate synthase
MNKPGKVFIIAEIAQAHDGSLGIAHSYIDTLAETGVDAVKFQTHIAHAESSEFEPFRVNFSYEDKTRYDYWKRMEFTPEQWIGLKKHCEDRGLEFISSPFSNAAVDLLESIGVKRYKVGSGEVNNLLLLDKIAKTGKPVILSSGMSSWDELDDTISFLKPYGNPVSILQCTTAYPTLPGQWSLDLIPELKQKYKLPIGYSDHSGKIHPCIAAAALGAEILEFHAVFDKKMFGPDAKASLTISEINQLVNAIRDLETDRNTKHPKELTAELFSLKNIFEKSLAVNKSLRAGDVITIDDLEAKKPKGFGIDANQFQKVVGRKIRNNLTAFSFLKQEDLL